MPRPRDPRREDAKRMWLESGCKRSLKSISDELGIAPARVRKWKMLDEWEKERPKSKGGAPKGNKNAKGSRAGGRGGNHALVTGEFETIFYSSLDEGERRLLKLINHKEKEILNQQIEILMIRERRIMERIQKLRTGEAELVTQKERTDKEFMNLGGVMYIMKPNVAVATVKESVDNRIVRLEEALTRIQAEIRRCVDSKRQLEESALKYF